MRSAAAGRAQSALLVLAFGGAVAVRVAVAGEAGPPSIPAGLVFAALLLTVGARWCPKPQIDLRIVGLGLVGVGVLVAPVVVAAHNGGLALRSDSTGYAGWALATAVVATAEEAFLRGALFGALQRWRGTDVAVVGAAVAFAALHVPLYGWHVLPLDFAVGLALGALRVVAGTWAAPAVAHVGADLVGWWLV